MPIRPENRKLYPSNWLEIRERIQRRSFDQCEKCGVKNHAVGYRDASGKFIEVKNNEIDSVTEKGWHVFKIVCTVAHLDHNPTNCDPDNLRFLCQKCHNRYDAPMRAKGIKKRKREINKTQMDLIK